MSNRKTMVTNDIEKVKVILYKTNGEILTDVTDNKSVVDFLASVMNFAPIEKKETKISNSDDLLYVDLGLPSGLKWAKCNVGAEKETDYGDYFMWGSAEPNTTNECVWKNYKHGDGFNFSKYNTVLYDIGGTIDNKATLDIDDDAAAQIMGGDWRMPTEAEIQELIDNTDSEWVEDFNGSGVNGGKFTSKVNGNSIFIPASGYRSVSSFYHQGSYGYVWSSSLNASAPNFAWGLSFDSDGICADYYDFRDYGHVVRGVMD